MNNPKGRPKRHPTVDELTLEQRADISRMYVDEKKAIADCARKLKLPHTVISLYLRQNGLKRSAHENSQRGRWSGENRATFAEAMAKRKQEDEHG